MEQIINSWVKINFNAWMLAMEASIAVPMRAMRILAGGPAGRAELRRTVDESQQAVARLPAPAEAGMRLLETGMRSMESDARDAASDARRMAAAKPATKVPKLADKAARRATRKVAKASKPAEKAIRSPRTKAKATRRRVARSSARS